MAPDVNLLFLADSGLPGSGLKVDGGVTVSILW